LRRLRIPPPAQLPLAFAEELTPDQRWWSFPEEVRQEVLLILARLIARGVIDEEDDHV